MRNIILFSNIIMAKKFKIPTSYLLLHLLSLVISLYIGYSFVAYTDAVEDNPICETIEPGFSSVPILYL